MEYIYRFGGESLPGEGGLTVVGGGDLGSTSSSSYIEITNASGSTPSSDRIHRGFSDDIIGYNPYTPPENKRILQWQIWRRVSWHQTDQGLGGLLSFGETIENRDLEDDININASNISIHERNSIQSIYTQWMKSPEYEPGPYGDPLTWGNGPSFEAQVLNQHTNNIRYRLYTLRIAYHVITEPIVNNVRPDQASGDVSKNPLIKWNYTGNGEPQKKYQVMIMPRAQADEIEAGWDWVAWNTQDYAAGAESTSSVAAHQFTNANLTNGEEYVAFVLVAKDFNGGDYFSAEWQRSLPFTINTKPSVSIWSPAGEITDTNRPGIAASFFDDSGTMKAWRGKLFQPSVYTDPGFDPETFATIYDSGVVPHSDPAIVIDPIVTIPNGTYRLYMKVQEVRDNEWSDWTYSEFTINVLPPDPALLTLTPQPEQGRVKIDIDHAETGPVPEEWFVRRSDDGGQTWVEIIDGYQSPRELPYTLYDYELPGNKPVLYQAVLFEQIIGSFISSEPTIEEVTLPIRKVWLKDIQAPEDNIQFPVQDTWLQRSRYKAATIHRPIGRELPVVVRSSQGGEAFSITYTLVGDGKEEQLLELLGRGRILLVQTAGTKWYVEVTSVSINEHLWGELRGEPEGEARLITVGYQEVERPLVFSI